MWSRGVLIGRSFLQGTLYTALRTELAHFFVVHRKISLAGAISPAPDIFLARLELRTISVRKVGKYDFEMNKILICSIPKIKSRDVVAGRARGEQLTFVSGPNPLVLSEPSQSG